MTAESSSLEREVIEAARSVLKATEGWILKDDPPQALAAATGRLHSAVAALDAGTPHDEDALDGSLPDEVTVGRLTYLLRPFTPKRSGESAGHDWLRTAEGRGHASANAEVNALVDEIVRLRAGVRAGEAAADRDVLAEIKRGVARFGDGSMSGPAMTDLERYPVLVEEVGEVAEALVLRISDGTYRKGREHHKSDLRDELVQVAACALGWVMAIDKQQPAESPAPAADDEEKHDA